MGLVPARDLWNDFEIDDDEVVFLKDDEEIGRAGIEELIIMAEKGEGIKAA